MIFVNSILLRCYADCLYAPQPKRLLGSILRALIFGKTELEVLRAIDYHAACKPARQGRQLIGFLDTVTELQGDAGGQIQISGWLFHRKKRIVSLVLFDQNGVPAVADIGLPRPDLFAAFPHERFAGSSGFRFVTRKVAIQGESYTFRAILADSSMEYGTFEPCALPPQQ